MDRTIFVFGSNLEGRHGAGAALEAKIKWGAAMGVGYGRTGAAFAIPTKETPYKSLSLEQIKFYVDKFQAYAYLHPEYHFLVTPIGCGLAGYTPAQIAPMFDNVAPNVELPQIFKDILYDTENLNPD